MSTSVTSLVLHNYTILFLNFFQRLRWGVIPQYCRWNTGCPSRIIRRPWWKSLKSHRLWCSTECKLKVVLLEGDSLPLESQTKFGEGVISTKWSVCSVKQRTRIIIASALTILGKIASKHLVSLRRGEWSCPGDYPMFLFVALWKIKITYHQLWVIYYWYVITAPLEHWKLREILLR